MAFDYGTKRIGIAVTDPLQIISSALTTVHPLEIIDFIKKYIENEAVETFVVGKPLQMDGSDSQVSKHVLGFTRQLKKNFPSIPVVSVDERFTSKMASASIAQSDLSQKKKRDKSLVDQVSAVLILQSYMQNRSFI